MSSERKSNMQWNILEFIADYIRTKGWPPTQREIAVAMGLSSTGSVDYHLAILERMGYISRQAKTSRGIKLREPSRGIQVRGRIAAGEPLEIFEDPDETIDVGRDLERENTYALVVKGGSMIDDHICDGDYVVIKRQSSCENGDIVVAVHREGSSGSATLKRFFQEREQDRVRLQPANSEMNPIYVPKSEWYQEWEVQGKVVALLRYSIQNAEGFRGVAQGEDNTARKVYQNGEKPIEKIEQVSAEGATKLKLFAVAHAELEEDDRALIGKIYSLQAGISQNKPKNYESEPFDLLTPSIVEPISFDILLHTSENIELLTEWQKHLRYNPRDLGPQLVEFTFRVVAPERSSIAIDFYYERRWLRTVHFEFDAVEQSQLTAISSEG